MYRYNFSLKSKKFKTQNKLSTHVYFRRAASAALHEYGRLHVNTVYSVYSRFMYMYMYKFDIIIYMYTTRLSTYYT